MSLPERGFKSWRLALEAGQLTTKQIAVLEGMISDGQADTLEQAAVMLDWQESVIQPDEHMYGF